MQLGDQTLEEDWREEVVGMLEAWAPEVEEEKLESWAPEGGGGGEEAEVAEEEQQAALEEEIRQSVGDSLWADKEEQAEVRRLVERVAEETRQAEWEGEAAML
eukprot:SM000002S05762  [mRNA]  locus=s2:2048807:2049448:- [translate_table: standard]